MATLRSLATALLLATLIVAGATYAIGQSTGDSGGAVTTFSAQPGDKPAVPRLKGQPDNDRTLEIAPQTAIPPAEKSVREIPAEKTYKPSDDTASLEKRYNPLESQPAAKPHQLPYLGISVEYTLKCYLGQEEHGLEIVNVDPDSPAAEADLKGRGHMTPLGAAGVTAGALLGPLELAVVPLLQRAGQLGQDGDLIVAVDDHRIRSELDLEDELAKLRPGDTMYLTVIRPLPSGAHKTMKIAVKVGEPGKLAAQSSPAQGSPAATEQYAY